MRYFHEAFDVRWIRSLTFKLKIIPFGNARNHFCLYTPFCFRARNQYRTMRDKPVNRAKYGYRHSGRVQTLIGQLAPGGKQCHLHQTLSLIIHHPIIVLFFLSYSTLRRRLAPLRTDFMDIGTALRFFFVSVFSQFQLSLHIHLYSPRKIT